MSSKVGDDASVAAAIVVDILDVASVAAAGCKRQEYLAYTSLLTALQLKEILFHPKDMIAWITKLESIYQKGQGLMKDSFWSWKTLFIIRMHLSRPSAFDNNETETILSLAIRISEVYINYYCVICCVAQHTSCLDSG